mmetsp:Transcript_860/g.1924  ORF Transcript_860/g.1924 Transcript_860/m.1924 type:complete len:113 (+) Transcript_860:157-495(+)
MPVVTTLPLCTMLGLYPASGLRCARSTPDCFVVVHCCASKPPEMLRALPSAAVDTDDVACNRGETGTTTEDTGIHEMGAEQQVGDCLALGDRLRQALSVRLTPPDASRASGA